MDFPPIIAQVYEATTEDVVHFAGNLSECLCACGWQRSCHIRVACHLVYNPTVAEDSGTQDPSGVFVLRLQGLPYRATEQEIVSVQLNHESGRVTSVSTRPLSLDRSY